MPNQIFYIDDYIDIKDTTLVDFLILSLPIIDDCIKKTKHNQWLKKMRSEWFDALHNQAHNLRDLNLDALIDNEESKTEFTSVLNSIHESLVNQQITQDEQSQTCLFKFIQDIFNLINSQS